LFLALGHFIDALFQSFDPIGRPASLLLSPEDGGCSARACYCGKRRYQTQLPNYAFHHIPPRLFIV
jgi:hypothetical protein